MGRDDIHKHGKDSQFSKENQPDPKLKSEGWQKRRELRELANALITGEALDKAKGTALRVGINLSDKEYTIEMILTLRQIEKALTKGDTRAYNAAMDRMVGKPIAIIDVEAKVSHEFDDKTDEQIRDEIKRLIDNSK